MRRVTLIASLVLVLASCGGDETVESTLPSPSTTTKATATTTVAPTTTESSSNESTSTTTPRNGSTTEGIGSEIVVARRDAPAFARESWIGLVFSGEPDELLPVGFESVAGKCIGDPDSDDFCGHSLDVAQSVDDSDSAIDEWLILLGRSHGRDAVGTPEWEVVDLLYVATSAEDDLTLYSYECWADSHPHVDFGVGERSHFAVRPLRAWYADWESETITELPTTSGVLCSEGDD